MFPIYKMKVFYLMLMVSGIFSCHIGENCTGKNGLCYWWDLHSCCCPHGCLGFIVGTCWSNREASNINYTITDGNDKILESNFIVNPGFVSDLQLQEIFVKFKDSILFLNGTVNGVKFGKIQIRGNN